MLITGFPLFHGVTSDGARMLLEYGEVKEYLPGEVLIKGGDGPTFVLLVFTGKMQVLVERQRGKLILATWGRGRSWVS